MFFSIFEVLIIIVAIWFIANIINFLGTKYSNGGFFGLSNNWIKKEEKVKKNEKAQIAVVLPIMVGLGILIGLMTFGMVNVRPTQVAVETNKALGKVNPEPQGVGYHLYQFA